jgi:adenylate kinase
VNILLLGPQGAGKGTQAKRIASEYGLAHIATGDMLREQIALGTELGRRVKPIYERGELVPDDLIVEMIRARLAEEDAGQGFVLDGFPRTIGPADALDRMLREIGRDVTVVLELQLPTEVAVQRLLKRAVEEGRIDDTPEAIKTRLQRYFQETAPVVEHYRATGNLVGIHADRPINEVFAEVQRTLDQVAVR